MKYSKKNSIKRFFNSDIAWLLVIPSVSFFVFLVVFIGLFSLYFGSSLKENISVVTVSLTAFYGIISVFYSQWHERKREIEKELRDKKLNIYKNVIYFWIDIVKKSKIDEIKGIPSTSSKSSFPKKEEIIEKNMIMRKS